MGETASRSRVHDALLLLAVLLLLTLPRVTNIDSTARLDALDDLFLRGTIPTVKYSVIGPLFATPFWQLGEWTDSQEKKEAVVWMFNRLLFLAAAGGLWWALRPSLSVDVRRRFLLLLAFASMAPYQLFYFSGEVFTSMCLAFGTAAAVVRRAWWGWLIAAVGAANIPATIPGFALAAMLACWDRRQLRYGLAALLAAGLVLIENAVRRGNALDGGYDNDAGFATMLPFSGRPGFSYPLFFGMLSILLSFGKGLVFFTPGLFVPLGQSGDEESPPDADLRLLHRMWLGIVIGLVLVYAQWWSWYGGFFWGPRFFLFACVPASLILARRSVMANTLPFNVVLLLVIALSCWVGLNGVVYHLHGEEPYIANDYALEFVPWYVPECSPLWRPFVNPKPLEVVDWLRIAVFTAAASYLLAPVASATFRQVCDATRDAARNRPRFRF